MTALHRAITAALALSDAGIEPTRARVRGRLRGKVDVRVIDEAVIGVLALHQWIVDPGPVPVERTSAAFRARPEQRAKSNARCGSPF